MFIFVDVCNCVTLCIEQEALIASKEIILCEVLIDALTFWRWASALNSIATLMVAEQTGPAAMSDRVSFLLRRFHREHYDARPAAQRPFKTCGVVPRMAFGAPERVSEPRSRNFSGPGTLAARRLRQLWASCLAGEMPSTE